MRGTSANGYGADMTRGLVYIAIFGALIASCIVLGWYGRLLWLMVSPD
jgi:hypothetical protein